MSGDGTANGMGGTIVEESPRRMRHGGLDALRALCALFVIVNHATFLPTGAGTDAQWCTAVIYTIVFSAVPLFVMISGAFILNRDKNGNAWAFYWHSIKKLFPLSALMLLVYFCVDTNHPMQFIRGEESLYTMLEQFCIWYGYGAAVPLWYICMLPGLYLMVPLLIRLRQRTSLLVQGVLCAAFMALSYCQHGLQMWNLLHPLSAVSWLGYFWLGMILMNLAKNKFLPSAKCISWVALVVGALLVVRTYSFISEHDYIYSHIGVFMLPSVFVVSCLLFIVFSQLRDMRLHWVVCKFGEVSFLIYLTHILVFRILMSILFHCDLISSLHHDYTVSLLFTLSGVVITFLVSWGLQEMYNRVCSIVSAWFEHKRC